MHTYGSYKSGYEWDHPGRVLLTTKNQAKNEGLPTCEMEILKEIPPWGKKCSW